MTKKYWSEKETDYLVNNYHVMTVKEIAISLGRTKSSVGNKANALCLNKGGIDRDLTGNVYGKLTVLKKSAKKLHNRVAWDCMCDCGNKTVVTTSDLRSGHTKSCGCSKQPVKENEKYAKLTTVKIVEKKENSYVWECKCDCGNVTYVKTSNLTQGRVLSCGCLVKDRTGVQGKRFGRLVAKERFEKDESEGHHNWLCQCDCGNTTIVDTDNLNRGHTKSCGCLRRDLVTGEGSRFYNPELSDEERAKNNRYDIKNGYIRSWREKVYERDNYTCRLCNQRGGDLNAHHLDGWHWCKERRFDLDNGVTLCEECHKGFHKEYGQGSNTEEQFEEYVRGVRA